MSEKESLLQAYGARIWGRLESTHKHLTSVSNKDYALEAVKQMVHHASGEISVFLRDDCLQDLIGSLLDSLRSAVDREVQLRIVSISEMPTDERYSGLRANWKRITPEITQKFKVGSLPNFSFLEVDQRHTITFDEPWMLALNCGDLSKAAYEVVDSFVEIAGVCGK